MDYNYILDKLDYISQSGTVLTRDCKYEPACNVAVMLRGIQQLIRTIQDEANKEQEALDKGEENIEDEEL